MSSASPSHKPDVPADLGEAGRVLWDYWCSLPRHDCVPYRRHVDPAAMTRILPVLSISEREAPGVLRVRLAGTGIRERAGRELTGCNYLDLLEPDVRQAEDRRLAAMLAQPCGSVGLRRNQRAAGGEYAVRILVLPLRDAAGEIRLLISTNEEDAERYDGTDERMTSIGQVDRRFVDIGAGVPVLPTGA